MYRATAPFPTEERYALTHQIRRAAASIPTNIAEGCGRGGEKELARFLQIAMGSASELEYHLLLSKELGFLDVSLHHDVEKQTTEVKRMLTSFIKKLTADS